MCQKRLVEIYIMGIDYGWIIMENLTTKNKIILAADHSRLTVEYVAMEFFGDRENPQSQKEKLIDRARTDKFSIHEWKKLADIMGCEFVSEFTLCDGTVLYDGNGKFRELHNVPCMNWPERVQTAQQRAGMKRNALCAIINVNPSSFFQRLKRDKFSTKNRQDIAEALGGSYRCYFRLADGEEI